MDVGEAVLLTGLGAGFMGLCTREVYQFWRWRSSLHLDRQEWARVVRELRSK